MCQLGHLSVQYLQAIADDAERERVGVGDQNGTSTPLSTLAVPSAAALQSVIQELQDQLGSQADVESPSSDKLELPEVQQQIPGCTQELLTR